MASSKLSFIDVHKTTGIELPAILSEAKIAVTTKKGFTRFEGNMEFSGINHKIYRYNKYISIDYVMTYKPFRDKKPYMKAYQNWKQELELIIRT